MKSAQIEGLSGLIRDRMQKEIEILAETHNLSFQSAAEAIFDAHFCCTITGMAYLLKLPVSKIKKELKETLDLYQKIESEKVN